jgi:hypothetical protein
MKKRCFVCRSLRNIKYMRPLNNFKQQYVCKEKRLCHLKAVYGSAPIPVELLIHYLESV